MKRLLRVLMVNHAYVRWMNRLGPAQLAEKDDMEVHVLAPQEYLSSQGRTIPLEPDAFQTRYHLATSPTRWEAFRGPFFNALPRIVSDVRPDIIFVAYEPGSLAAWQATWLSRSFGCKVVCFTVDNLYKSLMSEAFQRLRQGQWMGAAAMFIAYILERMTVGRVDYLLACNEEAWQTFGTHRGYRGQSAFIPLGVDLQQFRPLDVTDLRQKLGLRDFVFGFFGRTSPEKGIHLLIEAASQLKRPFHILIDQFADALEDRRYLEELMELARSRNIVDRVIFFDAAHAEMPNYINCADCVVLPSITTQRKKEQYGRVIPEAMACGVPVIGSSSGNIPYMIGDAGLIFPEGDVPALRGHLERIMDDAALCRDLVLKGRRRVESLFSLQVEADTYHDVFHSLVNRAG